VSYVTPHHPSVPRSPHRAGVATKGFISFSKNHLLDSSSSAWIGDYQYRLLLFLSDLEEVRPRDLVPHFCSNPKSAYAVVRRLEKRGVLKRVGRGVYRVVRDAVRSLLRLPVRCIRGGARRGSAARSRDGTTPVGPSPSSLGSRAVPTPGSAPACARPTAGLLPIGNRSAAADPAPTAGPGYLGLYLDNLRWRGLDGRYRQLPRSRLLRPGGLDPEWRVAYAEVTHVVGSVVLDGVVVVYTNAEDFGRFGTGAVRVEWRPPSGYVGRNGLASTLLLAKHELVKAFKAMTVVLGEVLPARKLLELYSWIGRVWGVV
jgi:hypothetical protein